MCHCGVLSFVNNWVFTPCLRLIIILSDDIVSLILAVLRLSIAILPYGMSNNSAAIVDSNNHPRTLKELAWWIYCLPLSVMACITLVNMVAKWRLPLTSSNFTLASMLLGHLDRFTAPSHLLH